ncbi:hypothetical protein PVK06_042350 [Gossypium arboreum]|uniref:Uncharacterized protein n=1 Tax=Gossypium arboreum TaxID=29729 RepID=A0ABR0ML30_GOSAR|nr:hypothetical protein PVK06_042350 [Gossypium arboreum]
MEILHNLDLWGNTDENWRDYQKEFINIWDCIMKFLPIREPFFLIGHNSLFGVHALVQSY